MVPSRRVRQRAFKILGPTLSVWRYCASVGNESLSHSLSLSLSLSLGTSWVVQWRGAMNDVMIRCMTTCSAKRVVDAAKLMTRCTCSNTSMGRRRIRCGSASPKTRCWKNHGAAYPLILISQLNILRSPNLFLSVASIRFGLSHHLSVLVVENPLTLRN
jgi:hypothetical protein